MSTNQPNPEQGKTIISLSNFIERHKFDADIEPKNVPYDTVFSEQDYESVNNGRGYGRGGYYARKATERSRARSARKESKEGLQRISAHIDSLSSDDSDLTIIVDGIEPVQAMRDLVHQKERRNEENMPRVKIVFDIETTFLKGFNSSDPSTYPEILQIALLKLDEDDNILGSYQSLVHIEHPLDKDTREFNEKNNTGITDLSLAHAPSSEWVANGMMSFIFGSEPPENVSLVLIGQNSVAFDLPIVQDWLSRLGMTLQPDEHIDTCLIARKDFPDDKISHTLGNLVTLLGGAGDFGAHNALEDVKATHFVYTSLMDRDKVASVNSYIASAREVLAPKLQEEQRLRAEQKEGEKPITLVSKSDFLKKVVEIRTQDSGPSDSGNNNPSIEDPNKNGWDEL